MATIKGKNHKLPSDLKPIPFIASRASVPIINGVTLMMNGKPLAAGDLVPGGEYTYNPETGEVYHD